MKNSVSNLNLPNSPAGQSERIHLRKLSGGSSINNICISAPVDYQETYYDEAAENSFYTEQLSSGSRKIKENKIKQRG